MDVSTYQDSLNCILKMRTLYCCKLYFRKVNLKIYICRDLNWKSLRLGFNLKFFSVI